MPLETGSYISDLVVTNPAHTDSLSQTDAHIRLIKAAIRSTFPNVSGEVALTQAQLNRLAEILAFEAEPGLGFRRTAAGIMTFVGGVLRGNGLMPAGCIADFAMPTAPTGWITCDGQSLLTSAQPDLFAAIGYTWGGSGPNFNVPMLVNRYRRHRDNSVTSGIVGTLQDPIIGSHLHSFTGITDTQGLHAHNVSASGNTSTVGDHTHVAGEAVLSGGGAGGSALRSWGGAPVAQGLTNPSGAHAHSVVVSGATDAQGWHAHNISGTTAANSASADNRPYSATVLTCIKL